MIKIKELVTVKDSQKQNFELFFCLLFMIMKSTHGMIF